MNAFVLIARLVSVSGCRLLLCIGLLFAETPAAAADMMLPQVYNQQSDISGWLMSEKLDGVRGRWDGKHLRSKNGYILAAHPDFLKGLPPFPLEGELWRGRGLFEQTVSIVKQLQPHPGWLELKFAIFDAPAEPGNFTARLATISSWFAEHPSPYAFVIPQTPVRERTELLQELARIESLGGEGLIVRNPAALYAAGRSSEILKVKKFLDAEATVVAHLPGKGRHLGRLGALLVQLDDGTQFKLGSGFSDAERESPPQVGAKVTFKFFGTYPSGAPKFPVFLRIRTDKDL